MTLFIQDDFFEPWLEYRHAAVRQLAFAVASPNILQQLPSELEIIHCFELHQPQIWQQHYQAYQPRLQQLDQDPSELIQFLAQLKSTRLGLRFEMLIWFWLRDHDYHPYRLLGHSIQKIEGPKTLGELDFLLLNTETQRIEHWEVALKYYLGEADLKLQHWYGLNRADKLQRKLNHFTQKQFQFSDALDYPIQTRIAVLKGQLYLPQTSTNTALSLPNWINLQRRLGEWGHAIPSDNSNYRLERHEWICPNQHPTSQSAFWWTDGLYLNQNHQFYMFRAAPLLSRSPI